MIDPEALHARLSAESRLVPLCQALGLGSDPADVLSRLFALYAEVDASVSRGTRGLELPCRAGCSACCYEAVFVSAPEFLAVAAELLKVGLASRMRVLEQMRDLARRFEDELELLEVLPAGLERDEVAARVRFRCPLLGPDELCSVYGVRELNARTFGKSFDGIRGEAYGCQLTHGRLRVLGTAPARLPDAREFRRTLMDRIPFQSVHVYPWWFDRYGIYLESGSDGEASGSISKSRKPGGSSDS